MKPSIPLILILFLMSCQGPAAKKDQKAKLGAYDALSLKIELALVEDQKIRKEYSENTDKSLDIILNRRMGQIDSINLILALSYLDNYGWPKRSVAGKKVSDGVFYIIQHSDTEIMKKYLSQFKAMAEIDEASKTQCALMTDRVLTEEGKKQIYGTQAVPRRNKEGFLTKEYYIWPIENPDSVNILRSKMGFEITVEAYAKELDASYNPLERLK